MAPNETQLAEDREMSTKTTAELIEMSQDRDMPVNVRVMARAELARRASDASRVVVL